MKKVSINYLYNSLYQILIIFIPLITTPYLSRVIGSEGIGQYSFSYSVAYYFSMFIMLGLNNYGNRSIAIVKEDKLKLSHTFKSIYLMQFIFGLFICTIYFIFCYLYMSNVYSYIMGIYVFSSIIDINWLFFGLEEFKITVLRNTIIKVLTVVFIFLFVKNSNDVTLYCIIIVVGFLLSNIILWPFVPRYVVNTKVSFKDVKNHIKPNLILFIPVIAISIYKFMDKIMLGGLSNMNEVGYFESSEKVLNIPLALINSLGTVMLPRMSNLLKNKKNKKNYYKIIELSILFGMIITVPMSFGIMGISREFVPLFYGEGFEKCISIFMVLLPSCIFVTIANIIRTQYLIPMEMNRIYIVSVSLGAIVNLLINFVTIPKLGALGAGFATFVAETIVCLYQVIKIRKEIVIFKYMKKTIPIILLGMIMFIIVFNLSFSFSSLINLFLKISVGIAIYLIPLIFYLLYLRKKRYFD